MLCDDLEGWDGGVEGRLKRKGIYVSVWLIYIVVQQKIMKHCKAIIFQFKEKRKAVGFVFRAGLTAVQFLRRGSVGQWPWRSAQGQLMETDWTCTIQETVSILIVQTAGCPWLFLRKAFQGVGMPSSTYRPAGRKFPR